VANDRLRDALHGAGLTPRDLAAQLGVDPKTAERWITLARTPYRKHRHTIAAMLRESEGYLWPDALSDEQRNGAAKSEIVQVYPRRGSAPADLWPRLFNSAKGCIDVLVYAGLFLPEQHPQLLTALCDKASAGVRLRLLLGDPECPAVKQRGEDEGIGGAVAAKIRNVAGFYRPHAEHGCTDVRFHDTTLYSSIYRFDNDMLVNPHVYGLPAAHAPLLHLRRLSAGDLFDTYASTYERIWATAALWSERDVAL
jgi:lambda repressor-like predicted transcriptional regulator